MGFVELLLIGVGLSMDAFAVSICKGLGMQRVNWGHSLVIALFFGGFQALMPLLGWALGSQFAVFVTPVAPWVAFALLAFVGGKMLWDAFHEDEGDGVGQGADKLDLKELLMLAIATSIDAFAVGLSFAFLQVNIVSSVVIIGVTTFALSLVGVSAGNVFGSRWERPSTIAGGAILILIGLHTLLDGLGILPF